MKTLILYATKHGATGEIATALAKEFEGATLIDLANTNVPAPNDYDQVIIGSSVYAGMLRKEAKAYVTSHADALKAKPLGLFISGMAPEGAQGYLDSNYPKDLVAHAKAKAMLGGVSDPQKQGFFERLVMRLITKKAAYISTISNEKIAEFARMIKA